MMRSGFTAAKKQPMAVAPVLGRVKSGENVERKRGSTPLLDKYFLPPPIKCGGAWYTGFRQPVPILTRAHVYVLTGKMLTC